MNYKPLSLAHSFALTAALSFSLLPNYAATPAATATSSANGSATATQSAPATPVHHQATGSVSASPDSPNVVAAPPVKDSRPDPVPNCQAFKSEHAAPAPKKRKQGPVRFVAKALASEFKTEGDGMLRDSAFVFSAKDFDPYAGKVPTDKPYTVLELELVDGSSASIIRYPDDSCKIVGSYLDNTVICPDGTDTYIVAYPNGARSKMVRVSESEYKMYRPDKTTTTLKKAASGEWSIENSKLGYLGTAQPDRENLQFEVHSKDY